MAEKLTATSDIDIQAEPAAVWATLTDLELMSRAFFGAKVETDWQEGSPITFSGEWEGKQFQDKGEVLKVKPNRLLRFTHFSPLSGQPDVPENYHTVSVELKPREERTQVTITQTNAASEQEREHSAANWAKVLGSLKELTER